MNRISPFALMLCLFSLVFAAGFWFLVIPKISQAATEQAELQALLVKPAQSVDQSTGASSASSAIAQALVLIPEQDDQYDLTIQLEALLKGLSLPIGSLGVVAAPPTDTTTVSPAVAALATGVKVMNITVQTTGSYDSIQNLVKGMVGINRYLVLNQVSLTGDTAGANITAQIAATAYYLPPNASVVVTPSPSPTL